MELMARMPTLRVASSDGDADASKKSHGRSENETGVNAVESRIKQEPEEEDAMPPYDVVPVSPSATPAPDAGKYMPRYEDEDNQSHETNGTSAAVSGSSKREPKQKEEEAVAHQSRAHSSNENSENVYLSLIDDKYKKIIQANWEKLWGESRDGDSNPKAHKVLGQNIVDEFQAEMNISGGEFMRRSKGGNSFHPSSTKEALFSKSLI